MTPGLVAIAAYLTLQLAIGVWISRRIRNESDYLLAGRSLGYTFATFSIFATWFGSETVVGSAGNAFRDGVSLASAEPFGYGLCLVLMGLVFAGPLWRRKLTTLADLFRQRYSVPVERLAAVILIPGSILWAAAQIRSFGYVVATAAPSIPIDSAIGGAAAFTLLYTVFGGLLADVIHDLLQGVTIIIGLIVLLVGVLLRTGLGRRHRAGACRCRADRAPARWRGTFVLGHRRGVGHPGLRLGDRDGAGGPHHCHAIA